MPLPGFRQEAYGSYLRLRNDLFQPLGVYEMVFRALGLEKTQAIGGMTGGIENLNQRITFEDGRCDSAGLPDGKGEQQGLTEE